MAGNVVKGWAAIVVLSWAVLGASSACGDDVWSVKDEPSRGKLEIQLGGEPFATYSYRDASIPRPYFANIFAPGGVKVTRNHPPAPGDADDHATFHPGLWLAFGDVSGNDYWRLKAAVRHVRFVADPRIDGGECRFAVENDYLDEQGGMSICREVCRYALQAVDHGVLMIWDSTFQSPDHEFAFGDQEEMGLGVRLATPIAVKSKQGGRILNADGGRNEDRVWGRQADWCDYSGWVGEHFVGVTLMPDPQNFRRSWYHARDYGFVTANPFGRHAFTRGERSRIVASAGEEFRLRYGVYIHGNERAEDFDPAAAYRRFLAVKR